MISESTKGYEKKGMRKGWGQKKKVYTFFKVCKKRVEKKAIEAMPLMDETRAFGSNKRLFFFFLFFL